MSAERSQEKIIEGRDSKEWREARYMSKLLEEAGLKGIQLEGATNGYLAHLKTSRWIVESVDQNKRGFITSYRDPESLPISQSEKKIAESQIALLGGDAREEAFGRLVDEKLWELRESLDYRQYQASGGSATRLCMEALEELDEDFAILRGKELPPSFEQRIFVIPEKEEIPLGKVRYTNNFIMILGSEKAEFESVNGLLVPIMDERKIRRFLKPGLMQRVFKKKPTWDLAEGGEDVGVNIRYEISASQTEPSIQLSGELTLRPRFWDYDVPRIGFFESHEEHGKKIEKASMINKGWSSANRVAAGSWEKGLEKMGTKRFTESLANRLGIKIENYGILQYREPGDPEKASRFYFDMADGTRILLRKKMSEFRMNVSKTMPPQTSAQEFRESAAIIGRTISMAFWGIRNLGFTN